MTSATYMSSRPRARAGKPVPARSRSSLSFEGREHLFGVAVWLYVLEDLGDLAFAVDQEGCPGDALHFLPIHIFFFDDAEGFADLFVWVGEQVIGKVVLL